MRRCDRTFLGDPDRWLVRILRGETDKAEALRSMLEKALVHPKVRTAFDVFGSELPDETFATVFDQLRL